MPVIGESTEVASNIASIPRHPLEREMDSFLLRGETREPKALEAFLDYLSSRSSEYAAVIKSMNPDIEDQTIESVIDFVLGPIRVPNQPEDKKSEEGQYFREISARIQHNYVDQIFQASQPDADPVFAERVYRSVALLETLRKSRLPRLREIGLFIGGVRAERAVIRALLGDGYTVTIPNYNQPEYDKHDNPVETLQKEVLQWDVLNGVDFVARKGDVMLFIDTKGKKYNPDNSIRSHVTVREGRLKIPWPFQHIPQFQKMTEGAKIFASASIVIPTSYDFLSGLPSTHRENPNKTAVLANYAVSGFESEITSSLQRMIKYRQ